MDCELILERLGLSEADESVKALVIAICTHIGYDLVADNCSAYADWVESGNSSKEKYDDSPICKLMYHLDDVLTDSPFEALVTEADFISELTNIDDFCTLACETMVDILSKEGFSLNI